MYLVKRGDSVPPIRKPVVNGYWEIVGGSRKFLYTLRTTWASATLAQFSAQEITKIVILVMDSRFRIEREGESDDTSQINRKRFW